MRRGFEPCGEEGQSYAPDSENCFNAICNGAFVTPASVGPGAADA